MNKNEAGKQPVHRIPDDNLRNGLAEAQAFLSDMGIRLPVVARYGKVPRELIGTGGSVANVEKTGILTVTIRGDIEAVCRRMDIPESRIPEIVADTVLHETGHILLSYARGEIDLPGLAYSGGLIEITPLYDPWDAGEEERFAEDFVRYCRGSMDASGKERDAVLLFARCTEAFARDLRVSPGTERTA